MILTQPGDLCRLRGLSGPSGSRHSGGVAGRSNGNGKESFGNLRPTKEGRGSAPLIKSCRSKRKGWTEGQ